MGTGLIGLGLHAALMPGLASLSYGMPTLEPGWVAATGLRDVALGVMTFTLWFKRPDALRWFLPGLLLVPLGDIVLVLMHGGGLLSTLPHALGVGYIAALLFASTRETL